MSEKIQNFSSKKHSILFPNQVNFRLSLFLSNLAGLCRFRISSILSTISRATIETHFRSTCFMSFPPDTKYRTLQETECYNWLETPCRIKMHCSWEKKTSVAILWTDRDAVANNQCIDSAMELSVSRLFLKMRQCDRPSDEQIGVAEVIWVMIDLAFEVGSTYNCLHHLNVAVPLAFSATISAPST